MRTASYSTNEILALKSGSWRIIGKPTGIYSSWLSNMDSLAFVHGAFHWLGLSRNESVTSYDISNGGHELRQTWPFGVADLVGAYNFTYAFKLLDLLGAYIRMSNLAIFIVVTRKRVVKRSKNMDVDGTMEVRLQEEIIMDILSRLPVLSLLRFKCVSKYWMTLISEPYFTLKHLNHAKNNQSSQKILVLHAHCEILALKSGSWRKIDKRPSGVSPVLSDTEDSGAFVHGAFHWLDSLLKNSLISFRISNEVYGEIPLPEGMSLVFNVNYINGGSALEGMLCVYSTHIRRGIHTFKLWILKDYDVKESWN
ncbi:hypothetical protein BC332_09771 [Capsicum chinense]|nr:hypothetical protein BC332_09771 [Capsicum chinense]